jgi:uncharacterized protein (TIGR00255 family)
MIKSMTGYGRREGSWEGGTVTVELRAVNHRFLEVVARLPRSLVPLEDQFRRVVQTQCSRGRFELTVALSGDRDGEKTLSLNRRVARQYHKLLKDLQRDLRLGGNIDLALFAGFRDIIETSDRPLAAGPLKQQVVKLLKGALTDLEAMRRREGLALERDLIDRLHGISQEVDAIATRAPLVVQEYFERMKARVERLMDPEQVERGRLNQELAVYADRCDLTEEVTRLRSHLEQFTAGVKGRKPVGRTLDFLLQEMGREVNTIGSKANDSDISQRAVTIKGELEKIREQVQNIE